MKPIIEIDNLSFGYEEQLIIKQLSLSVAHGQFLAIAGPNGVGKTTLLNLICGLFKPASGNITIDSIPIGAYSARTLAQKVAVVRQEFVPVFDFTVTEVVSMARTPYLSALGFESEQDRKIVAEAMEKTDTARFAKRLLRNLSGGERQRVFITRALAQQTPVLLLDEPTTFLDLKHQVGIYDLLKTTQLEKGKTVVAVTHDINLAAQYCDEVLLLGNDNSFIIGKTKDVFSSQQIEKVFGVKTLSSELGEEKFFIPLGKFAKDTQRIFPKPPGS